MAAWSKPTGCERSANGCIAGLWCIERYVRSRTAEDLLQVAQPHTALNGDGQIARCIFHHFVELECRKRFWIPDCGQTHAIECIGAVNRDRAAFGVCICKERRERYEVHDAVLISAHRAPDGKIFSGFSWRFGSKTSRTRAMVARSSVE